MGVTPDTWVTSDTRLKKLEVFREDIPRAVSTEPQG